MKTTLKFDEKDVKEAIKDYAEKQGFKVTGDIKINLGTGGGNYSQPEYSIFSNITADCEKIVPPYDGGGPGGRD